jgi:hypothetical protein
MTTATGYSCLPILLAPQTFRLAKPFITISPKGDLARFHVILIFGQPHRPLYLHLFVYNSPNPVVAFRHLPHDMSALLPFRDINVHASSTHYAFSSPSSPSAPTLVVERPSGDIRLHDGKLLGGQRVTSIQGILGIISLRLGMFFVATRSL